MIQNSDSLIAALPCIADGEDKSSPFKNCIRNNYRHIRKWAKRTETDCFRIYEREIPSHPLAIDFYAGRFCIHYFSRYRDDEEPSEILVNDVEQTLSSIFGISPEKMKELIFWRTRIRRARIEQYEKRAGEKEFFTVHEYGIRFLVNLVDYLDTGLFLDHRETRKLVGSLSKGKRVLNLFAYTCSFSVHAALAGAAYTKSIDMSNTYTDWGRENFVLNSLPLKTNEIVRADCLRFLDDEIQSRLKYDIIIIDPPTLSRSKKMAEMFDIQEDYYMLLVKAMKLLAQGGTIFFSTNSRKFRFDTTLFENYTIQDITSKTIPMDFHNKKIHQCWKISEKENQKTLYPKTLHS